MDRTGVTLPAPGTTWEIDLLVVPDTSLILVASVIEPLRAANRIAGAELFGWRIFSPDGLPIETRSGIPVPVAGAFRPQAETRPLFVVSSYNWRRSATPGLKAALSRTARHRHLIAGIESGSWLLADSGVLDGFRATTHWEDHEEFAAAFPDIDLMRDRFVIDGKRITTGGSLPTLDLMLELMRRLHGYSLALEVSRLFIYEQGGPSAGGPVRASTGSLRMADERVSAAVRLMEEHIEAPLTLSRIGRRLGVSPRRLRSLFMEVMGVQPQLHYLALRLNAARRKVIETRLSLSEIAALAGFASPSAFARSYRAHYRESASDTRRRLKAAAKSEG